MNACAARHFWHAPATKWQLERSLGPSRALHSPTEGEGRLVGECNSKPARCSCPTNGRATLHPFVLSLSLSRDFLAPTRFACSFFFVDPAGRSERERLGIISTANLRDLIILHLHLSSSSPCFMCCMFGGQRARKVEHEGHTSIWNPQWGSRVAPASSLCSRPSGRGSHSAQGPPLRGKIEIGPSGSKQGLEAILAHTCMEA